jgi:hypothetical protein
MPTGSNDPFKTWLGVLGRRPGIALKMPIVFFAVIIGGMGMLQYGVAAILERVGLDHGYAEWVGTYVMMGTVTAICIVALWRVLQRG